MAASPRTAILAAATSFAATSAAAAVTAAPFAAVASIRDVAQLGLLPPLRAFARFSLRAKTFAGG